tara:strand:- start:3353 stop:4567 length:1215 start_codon:yes stop_codon:yes gene_type:complete
MANVTQLKHLEHLEDEMLNYGVSGCKASVSFLQELRKMLGCDNSTGFMQTKWDGAPSIVCGKDPANGHFFVGTKGVFAKTEPKICYGPDQIDEWYGDKANLAAGLKLALEYFSQLGIDGVIQGDFLFTSATRKTETIHGEKVYTFTPNTITYAIPVDHPLGKQIGQAKVGVVFHTHYAGEKDGWDISSMTARPGAKVKSSKDVVCIENDTPMDRVGLNHTEEVKFDKHVSTIEKLCGDCGYFLDELVTNTGTTGNEKWHVASYLKQFFNAEIKAARSITNVDATFASLYNFYYDKTKGMLDKIKTPANRVAKSDLVYKSQNYLRDNQSKFKSLLGLYKELQTVKQMVIDKLDKLETFKTFVRTDQGYKVTGPEGYVMHKDGDMIKFVNRLEFSYNNFTVAKSWR